MALARCEKCGSPAGKKDNAYSGKARLPINHPQSGVIRGSIGCKEPALIWLLDSEQVQYQKGIRIFELTGGVRHAKFAVQ